MATEVDVLDAARDERDRLQAVCDAADLALAMAAFGAGSVKKEFALVALVPAILRWRASREKTVQERLIEDPPRYDFDQSVEVAYESWDSRLLKVTSKDSRALLLRYIDASIRIVGFENALIDATEKQLGAIERGETQLAEDREREAEFFADEGALALFLCSAALEEVVTKGWISEEQSEARLAVAEPKLHKYWRAAKHRQKVPVFPSLPERLEHELHQLGVPADALPAPGSAMTEMYGMPRQAIARLQRRLLFNAATKRSLAATLQTGSTPSGILVRS